MTTDPTPDPIPDPEVVPAPPADPALFAIICGGCNASHRAGITNAAVAAFLLDHEECRKAAVPFRVEVPAAMVDQEDTRPGADPAHDVWTAQAVREGYRPASAPRVTEPTGRVAVVEGWVVPATHEDWRGSPVRPHDYESYGGGYGPVQPYGDVTPGGPPMPLGGESIV